MQVQLAGGPQEECHIGWSSPEPEADKCWKCAQQSCGFPFLYKKRVVLQIVKGVGQLFEVIFASKEAEIIKRK